MVIGDVPAATAPRPIQRSILFLPPRGGGGIRGPPAPGGGGGLGEAMDQFKFDDSIKL